MGLVFVDFTIITLYAANTGAFHTETFHIKTLLTEALDLFYALAMVVDAFSALFFCGLFDKIGLEAMIAATFDLYWYRAVGNWIGRRGQYYESCHQPDCSKEDAEYKLWDF
ncbi:MAG: hypothetical protein PUI42_06550 [Lachnospiraceae bacterium]|nr:hypothetical protein [Lachnospiraceae bacterium]MDY3730538.1 hypothetical protein [Candidatus Choladocola sp.]